MLHKNWKQFSEEVADKDYNTRSSSTASYIMRDILQREYVHYTYNEAIHNIQLQFLL